MRQARSGRWGVLRAHGVQGFERKRNVPVPPNTGASTVRPWAQWIYVLTEWSSGLLVVFYRGTSFRSSLASLWQGRACLTLT
jgi:hypothetical protein